MSADRKTSKNSSLAFVLGLPLCGFGHVVCGRPVKGVFLFVLFCASLGLGALVFLGPLGAVFPVLAAFLFWAFAFCLWIYSLADLWEIKNEPLPVLDRDHVPVAANEEVVVPALAPKAPAKEAPKAPVVESRQFEEEKKWFSKDDSAAQPVAKPEPAIVPEQEEETVSEPEQESSPEPAVTVPPTEDKRYIPLSEHLPSFVSAEQKSSRAEKSSAFSFRNDDEESVSPFPSVDDIDEAQEKAQPEEPVAGDEISLPTEPEKEDGHTAVSQLILEPSNEETEDAAVEEKEPETEEPASVVYEINEEPEELDPAQLAELVVEAPVSDAAVEEKETEQEESFMGMGLEQEQAEESDTEPEEEPEQTEEKDSIILEQERVREFTSAVLDENEAAQPLSSAQNEEVAPEEETASEIPVPERKEEEPVVETAPVVYEINEEPEELDPAQLAELVVEAPVSDSAVDEKEAQEPVFEIEFDPGQDEETAKAEETASEIPVPERKEEPVVEVVEEKEPETEEPASEEAPPVIYEINEEPAQDSEPEEPSAPPVSEDTVKPEATEKEEDSVPAVSQSDAQNEEENPADPLYALEQKLNDSQSDASGVRSGAEPKVYEYARTLQLKGLLGPAAAEYEKILCFNPYDADCLFQLGKIEFARGHREMALDYLTRCQQADSGGVWTQEILFLLEEHKNS